MKQYTKRMLAWVLATALLITCGISGLALPAMAEAGDVLVFEDFEGETTNAAIKNWKLKGEIVDDPINAGNKVLKVTSALSAQYTGKWGLKVNKLYKLTLKVYGGTGVYIRFNTSKGILNDGRASVNTTAGWTELVYFVKTTDQYNNFMDDAYTIALNAPVGSYVDDIKLQEVEDNGSLLLGGDFEAGESYYKYGAWADISKGGGVVVDPDDPTNHVMSFTKYSNQYYKSRIGIRPNSTYELSFRAKGKNLGIYLNASKGVATNSGWKKVLDAEGSEDWVNYSLTFETKASVDDASYVIAFNLANANNITGLGTPAAYIDDVKLTRAPATAISMSQDPLYLAQGATEPMELTYEPKGGRVDSLTWTSSDESIATVDADGKVTAATDKEGDVTITATVEINGTTLTASRVITVVGDADTFELADEALHLAPGVKKTAVVNASPKGAKIGTLTWSSSDDAVATVDANGVITAVAAGTATITVKTADDNDVFAEVISDTLTVTVDEAGERVIGGDFETADSATVTGGVGTVTVDSDDRNNQVLQLAASTKLTLGGLKLNPEKSYKLTFAARGTDVTTAIDGVAAGNAGSVKTTLSTTKWTTVTRYLTTGADASTVSIALSSTAAVAIDNVSLVELPDATGITMLPGATMEMIPGATSQVGVSAQPNGAFEGDITYSSTAPEIVAVDAKTGKLTAIAESGSAIIMATSKNEKGVTMTAAVNVTVDEYANILVNGDFELGTTSWGSSQVAISSQIVDGIGRDGGKGVSLKGTGTGKKIEVFYKSNIPLLPGTTYKISFDYKTTSSSITRLWTNTLGFGQVYSTNSNGEWKTASKVFTTSPNLKFNPNWDLCIVIEDGATEEMVVDNLRLEMYYSGVDAEFLEMDRKSVRLVPGRSTALGVVATPIDGDTNGLVWTSSNENVATVEYGVVTGVGKGTATITATTKQGKKASATVTVSGGTALIGNGTFDIANDKSWTVEGSASIADGVGVKETAAGKIEKEATGETAGKLSQIVKGLKPNTNYTLSVRYTGTGNAGIVLLNGTTELVKATETAEATWVTKTYEFKTPETMEADSTFALSLAGGNGPVYFDYILLSENATLIDMIVNDIFWTNGDGTPLEQDHQTTPGTELKFYVAMLNQGEDPITEGMTFDVDILVDTKVVQTITYTATEDIVPGAIVTIPGSENWAATAGDHTIAARVNSTLSILELDDSNNDKCQVNLHVGEELIPIPEDALNAGFDELIFNDEFESLHTIDTVGAGEAGYKWYITRPYSNYKQTPDDYEIKDGILTVKTHNVQYNYELSTIDDTTGRGFTFNKGYLEFRLRIPTTYDAAKEGTPAVWSFPADKILEKGKGTYAKQWVEMDWMEYWGITKDRPGGHWTVSMHETIRGYYDDGVNADASNVLAQHSAGNRHKEGLGDGEWHVISFLWMDDLLLGYLDGEQCFKITYGEGEFPSPMQINAATADGTGAFSYMNEQMLALILGGSVDNPMELDYIRVWGGTGAGYVPPADDDDDENEIVFDIEPEIFWNNYCLDDYAEPIMIETMDEYAAEYVVMGEEYWVLLSDARRAEINALLAENGQPTYEELLEAAKALLAGDSPATGESATVFPLTMVLMIACAGALWATRKRRART